MTITIEQYFDRYDISVQEISDLMSRYKSCKILLIDGNYMRYSFERGADLEAFLNDIKPHVVPYCEYVKAKTFKAKICRLSRKLLK